MKLGVFSVYDNKSKTYSQPFMCDSHPDNKIEVANRLFASMIKPGTMLYDFPEDYDLIYLGTYDDSTGLFVNENESNVDVEPVITGDEAMKLIERK